MLAVGAGVLQVARKAGAHDSAIREFNLAYESFPLPDFLFNIAQEYRA